MQTFIWQVYFIAFDSVKRHLQIFSRSLDCMWCFSSVPTNQHCPALKSVIHDCISHYDSPSPRTTGGDEGSVSLRAGGLNKEFPPWVTDGGYCMCNAQDCLCLNIIKQWTRTVAVDSKEPCLKAPPALNTPSIVPSLTLPAGPLRWRVLMKGRWAREARALMSSLNLAGVRQIAAWATSHHALAKRLPG